MIDYIFISDHYHNGKLIEKGTYFNSLKLDKHVFESLQRMKVLKTIKKVKKVKQKDS